MNTDKSISDALGIEPTKQIEIIPPEKKNEVVEIQEENQGLSQDEEDFKFVRETMKDLIAKGKLKMDEMGTLASELENARAFEVYGGLMEKVQGLAKDLYELHKKKKDLSSEEVPRGSDGVNIEKAVFVGNQTELLQELKKQNGTS